MQAETINSDNLLQIEWDENYFKFCTFSDFVIEGGLVASDFVQCSFSKVEWYWGLFSSCNFIDCTFADCTFAGTNFANTRFVDCRILNCTFKKNNLAGNCHFAGTTDYGCSVKDSTGFGPDASVSIDKSASRN